MKGYFLTGWHVAQKFSDKPIILKKVTTYSKRPALVHQ